VADWRIIDHVMTSYLGLIQNLNKKVFEMKSYSGQWCFTKVPEGFLPLK